MVAAPLHATSSSSTRRLFRNVVLAYCLVCLLVAGVIVLRGDGSHPRVVSVYPASGDLYWPGGIAEITFSQEMNHSSVERGLEVNPGSQGFGAWYGSTLNLQPVGDWKSGVTYRLSFVGTVTDTQGRPLHTPFSYWFRVHQVTHLRACRLHGVRNVCEGSKVHPHFLTHSPTPVLQYALSGDGSQLAFIRRDQSGLPHLFLIAVDNSRAMELTHGSSYADANPLWVPGDSSEVSYYRRPVRWVKGRLRLGKAQLWNVGIDGSDNAQLK